VLIDRYPAVVMTAIGEVTVAARERELRPGETI